MALSKLAHQNEIEERKGEREFNTKNVSLVYYTFDILFQSRVELLGFTFCFVEAAQLSLNFDEILNPKRAAKTRLIELCL